MAYQQLVLDTKTPTVVEHFVRQHLDMQFNDIHCMLRLSLPELGLSAGCNFAIANSLLALVSGIWHVPLKLDTQSIPAVS